MNYKKYKFLVLENKISKMKWTKLFKEIMIYGDKIFKFDSDF